MHICPVGYTVRGTKDRIIATTDLYVPAELLDFKFRILKNKGYRSETPFTAQANFLKQKIPESF